jgi:hypothetical protein
MCVLENGVTKHSGLFMVEILPDCQLPRYWLPNSEPVDNHFEALVAKGFDKYEITRY